MSSVAISLPAPERAAAAARGRFAVVGLATAAAAVIANVVVYFLAGALVGYDPRFLPLADVTPTIFFTLLPAVVATLLYAGLLRWSGNPARVFTIVAVVVFVVTLIPGFVYIPTVPGASVEQTAILVLMHLVAAGVIVGMLTSYDRPNER